MNIPLDLPPLQMCLPLPTPPALLFHADLMRDKLTRMFYSKLPGKRDQLRAYHANMLDLAQAGAILAVDLTVDIAYLTEDDPLLATPGLVLLDPEALAARIHDMLHMRARKLN